nr:insulinase family protein [Eubacterium sp.]
HITDRKRLKEIIAETKANIKNDLVESGHLTAGQRAASYLNAANAIKERQEGVDYYRFIDKLDRDFDELYDDICKLLKDVLKKILRKDNLIVSYTSDKKAEDVLAGKMGVITDTLSDEVIAENTDFKLAVKNEGFTAASQVQYCAAAASFKKAGLPYTGSLNILRIIFGYDYLWINVRVKGGAYGCSGSFSRSGITLMTSYRDPNLTETFDVFKDAYKYVEAFDVSERDMTKYIIGTIGSIDPPLTPQSLANFSYASYLAGVDDEMLQKERDEILSADSETIRNLAPYVKVLVDSPVVCAVGNENKIKEAADMFGVVENIYKS